MARMLEDYRPGERYESASLTVERDAIIAFAGQFDPQPFHTDDDAAENSFFKGLAASGWHTAALTMRLILQSVPLPQWGLIGRQVELLTWSRPVRPGDRLRVVTEVLEVRRSSSRPDTGSVRCRHETLNQDGQVVQTMIAVLHAPATAPQTV